MKRSATLMMITFAAAAAGQANAASMQADALRELVQRCAPQVHPTTMLALIRHESRGDPYAIGVNGSSRHELHPKDANTAIHIADGLLRTGRSMDLGLGQINAANLQRLHLTTATVFDPCRNVAAAAQLLTEAYVRLRPQAVSDQAALDAALFTYNTGSPSAGVVNGYVAAVRQRYTVPATPARVDATRRPTPAWDVYGAARQAPEAAFSAAPAEAAPVMVFETEGGRQ